MERLHKSSVRAVIPMACCALCAVVALFASAPKAEAARVFVAGGRAIVAAHPGFATAPAPVVVSVAPPRYVVADPVVTYRTPLLVAEESVVQTYVAPRKVVVTPTARTTTSFSLVIGGGSHYPPPRPYYYPPQRPYYPPPRYYAPPPPRYYAPPPPPPRYYAPPRSYPPPRYPGYGGPGGPRPGGPPGRPF